MDAERAKKTLTPDKMVWVVVGDRAKIEAGIKELGWGDVKAPRPGRQPGSRGHSPFHSRFVGNPPHLRRGGLSSAQRASTAMR